MLAPYREYEVEEEEEVLDERHSAGLHGCPGSSHSLREMRSARPGVQLPSELHSPTHSQVVLATFRTAQSSPRIPAGLLGLSWKQAGTPAGVAAS